MGRGGICKWYEVSLDFLIMCRIASFAEMHESSQNGEISSQLAGGFLHDSSHSRNT